MTKQLVIRAWIEPELKAVFEKAVRANDRDMSKVLRDLIREYVHRYERGEAWEPGSAVKRRRGT
jgi:hypothetical protein